MRTRERTSEVVIVSCDAYRIGLHFAGHHYERDTAVIEAPSFLGEDRFVVEVVANSQGQGNLVKFYQFCSKREIEIVLWLLERHQKDIHEALTQ